MEKFFFFCNNSIKKEVHFSVYGGGDREGRGERVGLGSGERECWWGWWLLLLLSMVVEIGVGGGGKMSRWWWWFKARPPLDNLFPTLPSLLLRKVPSLARSRTLSLALSLSLSFSRWNWVERWLYYARNTEEVLSTSHKYPVTFLSSWP